MNKNELLNTLREKLSGLPKNDIERSLEYYKEIIEDKIDEGISEDDAVAALGSVDDIAAQIRSEITPPEEPKAPKAKKPEAEEKTKKSASSALGALFSGLLMFVSVIFWCIAASFFIAVGGMALGALFSLFSSVVTLISARWAQAVLFLGGAFLLAGLTVLVFMGTVAVTKKYRKFTKKLVEELKEKF